MQFEPGNTSFQILPDLGDSSPDSPGKLGEGGREVTEGMFRDPRTQVGGAEG